MLLLHLISLKYIFLQQTSARLASSYHWGYFSVLKGRACKHTSQIGLCQFPKKAVGISSSSTQFPAAKRVTRYLANIVSNVLSCEDVCAFELTTM